MNLRTPLETPRLLIRMFTLKDEDAKFRLDCDCEIKSFMDTSCDRQNSLDSLKRIISQVEKTGLGPLAICKRDTNEVIGLCGLQHIANDIEVIVAVLREYRRNGYAKEAIEKLIAEGFAVFGVQRIIGRVEPGNEKSKQLVKRLGMKYVGSKVDIFDKEYLWYEATH